jgi:hypothetical protein
MTTVRRTPYILVAGAAVCALGVALGMWFPGRNGVMLTSAVYALLLAVAPILGGLAIDPGRAEAAWMSSPMVAAGALTIAIVGGSRLGFDVFAPLPMVIGAHACATAILLVASVPTLERRFARERAAVATPAPVAGS